MTYEWKEYSIGYTMEKGEAERQYAEWRASLPWWRRIFTAKAGHAIDYEHIIRRWAERRK